MSAKTKKSNSFRAVLSASGQAKNATEKSTAAARSARRLKEGYTQVGANIPVSLYREVKKRLPDEEVNFSELVEQLLHRWMEER